MANLITPQVTIKWGDENLSAYQLEGAKQPEPIAFNAEVTLPSDGNSSPTASFSWNPSGPAFKVFEDLVANKYKEKITIRFWYQDGPEAEFFFYYSGVEINYGVEMSVKVELSAVSAFKTNTTTASVSVDNAAKFSDKGKDAVTYIKEIEKVFPNSPKIKLTKCAEKDAKKVLIKRMQFKDQTYGSVIQNLMQQLGNSLVLTNIGKEESLVAHAPFTWEAKEGCAQVEEPPKKGKIDPGSRYGYLLGPGIITSFSRKISYTPPTSDTNGKPSQPKSTPIPKSGNSAAPGANPTKADEEVKKGQKPGSKSTQRSSSPSNVKGFQYSENPNGPQKQEAGKQEDGIKLNAALFMCPALVGIKPQDIVYVPSLKTGSKEIEDYIVQSVSYQQQGGSVAISIEASRTFGLSKPMDEKNAKKFKAKADTFLTLSDWEYYAWRERLGLPPV